MNMKNMREQKEKNGKQRRKLPYSLDPRDTYLLEDEKIIIRSKNNVNDDE